MDKHTRAGKRNGVSIVRASNGIQMKQGSLSKDGLVYKMTFSVNMVGGYMCDKARIDKRKMLERWMKKKKTTEKREDKRNMVYKGCHVLT